MNVPTYEQLLAENERLREEGRKDYEGMREFQQKYIAADQELRKLRAELDALLAWKEEAERQEPVGVLHVGSWYGEELQDWEFEADQTACDRLNEAHQHKEASLSLYARPVPAPSVPGTQAALDVLAERRRQIEAEGWTPEYDDKHSAGEMAKAAACYALVSAGFNPDAMINVWPWHRLWWRPRDKRRNLVKAAALILAEIERLDRAAEPKPEVK